MPWTDDDIAALEDIIRARKGAKSIQFSDQVLTFEPLKDQIALLEQARRDVAGAASAITRYAAFRKGC